MPQLIKYCPKCHQEAYRLVEEGDSRKVVLPNGHNALRIGKKSKVNMSISCPMGHKVPLKIGQEEVKVGTR